MGLLAYASHDLLTNEQIVDETIKPAVAPLTDEQKLLCTPLMRGFSLKNKRWLNFFVSAVRDIVWNDQAFEKLVLPNNQKELILSFAESQNKPEVSSVLRIITLDMTFLHYASSSSVLVLNERPQRRTNGCRTPSMMLSQVRPKES